MGGGGYDVMLELTLFIAAQWIAGRVFKQYGAPAILAEMITGIILGPELLKLVPYATEDHVTHDPSILVLIGNMGVSLMIFESGMHLHFDKVAQVGKQAFGIAVVGTMAPIVLGIAVAYALGFDVFPDALSIGVALAPTSVGISLNMLGSAKMLNSTPGQTIITAAFIDDIFSLVMLVILINVSKGDVTAGSILIPLVASFAFVGFGVFIAMKVMPNLTGVLKKVTPNHLVSLQPRDEVHILLMVVFVVFFGWIGDLIGSHLLGTFVAGVAFANVPRSGLIWTRQAKRIVSWMMRLFFSASIAFSIPVSVMFTVDAFWKGLVLAAIPCIGGKILSGQASGPTKWIVGWAMVARGEFAYLVAQTAKDAECISCKDTADHRLLASSGAAPSDARTMLSAEGYSALVWALLWSTILAPVFFKYVLAAFIKKRGDLPRANEIGGDLESQKGQRFVVRIVGMHHTGILHEVMDVLHACELDVLEAHAESDDLVDVDKFIVKPRAGGDIDEEKLQEIAARVKEAIDDEESQVVFEPIDTSANLDTTGVLEIRMIGDHHPDILHEIFDMLAEEKLDVVRAIVDEHTAMDHHGAHADGSANHSDDEKPKMTKQQTKRFRLQQKSGSGSDSDGSGLGKSKRGSTMHKLKESDVIYARGMNGTPIDPTKRANLRKRIQDLMKSHECHGEAMLKMVPEADAHDEVHPITSIMQDDEVCVITTHGTHHADIIHEVLDAIAALHLDVLHADITQPGAATSPSSAKEDRAVLYVKNVVDSELPEMEPATERERRHDIRKSLTDVFALHKIDGHVSVRPLEGKRPAVISDGVSAADAVTASDLRATSFRKTPVVKGNDLENALDKC
jgi:Kef-type K+ transport system membrane component KefB